MPEAPETAVTEHRHLIPGRVLPDKPIESLSLGKARLVHRIFFSMMAWLVAKACSSACVT